MDGIRTRLDAALQDATGLQREILAMQRWAAAELDAFHGGPASPEAVAYLGFWGAAFQQLDAVAHLLGTHLTLAAELLSRSAFEACVQMRVIMQPATDGGAGASGWALVRERLRAHTAYCLLRDEDFYTRHVLEQLDALHTPVSPRQPPASLEGVIDGLAAAGILPEPLVVSPQEAAHEARQTETMFTVHRERARRWLADARLAPYVARYRTWTQPGPGGPQDGGAAAPSWYALVLNERRATIRTALKRLGDPVLYGAFAKASGVLHRNSFTGVLAMAEDGSLIRPEIAGEAGATEEICRGIQRDCAYVVTALPLIRRHLLHDDTTSPSSDAPRA